MTGSMDITFATPFTINRLNLIVSFVISRNIFPALVFNLMTPLAKSF